MQPDFYDMLLSILLSISFGIVAIFFMVIGLRGILTKRPFLISQRWLLSIIFVIFILTILLIFRSSLFPDNFNFISWLILLLFGFILLIMWYQMRSYIAYGVADPSFREILLKTLQKLQLPYEENLSLIRLTSIEAELQVSVQKWRGTGVIKVKQPAHRFVLREIVNAMNEYFRMSSVSINMSHYVCFVFIGGFMVFTAVRMLSL